MLSASHRLRHRPDFSQVLRCGAKAGRSVFVVYALDRRSVDSAVVSFGGPRFGFIVNKAVGNSVVRHQTARRLRAACYSVVPDCDENFDVVVRALPVITDATTADLGRQLSSALRKMQVLRIHSREATA